MSPQEALKLMRAETGLTQIEMAEKLNIGFVTINRWENGKSFPNRANANNIIRTARDIGVSDNCLKYLNDVLLPSRMRGHRATALGFPALDQELLCQMVDSSPAGVVVIDEKTKEILYVNRRAEELAGTKFSDTQNRHCWSYLKRLDSPCADCDSERYPLSGYCERFDTTPDGRRLKNRTKSIIWKGRHAYIVYMTDESELTESKREVHMLTSLFPAGAGIICLYKDGRLELLDAFYHDLNSKHVNAVKHTGLRQIDSILGSDTPRLLDEVRQAVSDNRDVSAVFRVTSSGRWVQLYARQFWQDDEKRMFFCSFVDVDEHMKEMQSDGE